MPLSNVGKWLVRLGYLSLLTSVVVLVSDLIGWAVVEKHNPISETISRLAVGEHAWIQDLGLDVYAIGIVLIAVGMFLWKRRDWRWTIAAVLMLSVAVEIVIIAEYNQYAGFDGFGYKVHRWCCFALYVTVAVAALLYGLSIRRHANYPFISTIVFLVIWLIGGPIFMFVAPNSIDGGVERLIAIALVAWTSMVAWVNIQARSDKQFQIDQP